MRWMVALASVLVLSATVALPSFGQSSGGTLTKAQVIQQGSKICKAGEAKVNRLPQIKSQNPFAKSAPAGDAQRAIAFLAGYADALAGVRAGLAELQPPVQGRALLEGFIRDLGPTIATFRQARSEALTRRYDAALADVQKAFGKFELASKKTRAYGFPRGVCQAG